MKFHISASHVRQQNRKAIYLILFLAVACTACVVKLLSSKAIADMFFPIIGIIIFFPPIISSCKRIKEGSGAYPVIELDEPNGKVVVSHIDISVTVDLAQIKNLRLQHKSNHLESMILQTSSGETLRFEGYENLPALASVVERLTPKEHITNATLYHR